MRGLTGSLDPVRISFCVAYGPGSYTIYAPTGCGGCSLLSWVIIAGERT